MATAERTVHNRVGHMTLLRPGRYRWPDGVRCVVTLTLDFDGPSHETGRPPASAAGHQLLGPLFRPARHPPLSRSVREARRTGTFFVPVTTRMLSAGGHGHTRPRLRGGCPRLPARRLGAGRRGRRAAQEKPQVLSDSTGVAPQGCFAPSGRQVGAAPCRCSGTGCIYDSSDKDYDLPYMVRVTASPVDGMMGLPNSAFMPGRHAVLSLQHDAHLRRSRALEAGVRRYLQRSGYFMLMVHPRSGWGSGMPSRVRVMEDMIRYIKQHDGVRFFNVAGLALVVPRQPPAFRLIR